MRTTERGVSGAAGTNGVHEMPEPRVMTMEEAAAYLNVRVRFVRRLVEERRIPIVKMGRYVRFDRADLDAFIRAGRVDPNWAHR